MQQVQYQFSDWGFQNQATEISSRPKPIGCPPIQIKQKQKFKKIFSQDKSTSIKLTEQSEPDNNKNVSMNISSRAHRIFEDNSNSTRRKNSVNSFRDDTENLDNFCLKENNRQENKSMNVFMGEIKQMLAQEQKKIAEFLKENFSHNQEELKNVVAKNKESEQQLQSIKLQLSTNMKKLQQESDNNNSSMDSSINSVIEKDSSKLGYKQKQLEQKITQFEDQFEQMQLAYKTLAQKSMNNQNNETIQKMVNKFQEEINMMRDQINFQQQDLDQKLQEKKYKNEEQFNQLNMIMEKTFSSMNAEIEQKQTMEELAEFFNNNYGNLLLDISRDNQQLMQQFKQLQQNVGLQQNSKQTYQLEQLQQKILESEQNFKKFIQQNQQNLDNLENQQEDNNNIIGMLSSSQNKIDDSHSKQEEEIFSLKQILTQVSQTNSQLSQKLENCQDKTQIQQFSQRVNQLEELFQKKTDEITKVLKQKNETIYQLAQQVEELQKQCQQQQQSQKKKIFNNNCRDQGCQTEPSQLQNIQQQVAQISLSSQQKKNTEEIHKFDSSIKYSEVIVPKLSQFAQYSNSKNSNNKRFVPLNPEFRWKEYEQPQQYSQQYQSQQYQQQQQIVAKELTFDNNPSKIEVMLQQFEDYDENNDKIAMVDSSSSSSGEFNSNKEYHTSSESSDQEDELFMPGANSNNPSSQKQNQYQKQSYDNYLKQYEECITSNRNTINSYQQQQQFQQQQQQQYQSLNNNNNIDYYQYSNPSFNDNQINQKSSNAEYEYEHFYPKINSVQTTNLAKQLAEHQQKIQEQLNQFEARQNNQKEYASNQFTQQLQQEINPQLEQQQPKNLDKIEEFFKKSYKILIIIFFRITLYKCYFQIGIFQQSSTMQNFKLQA